MLVRPRGSANVGAAARAMKNMGVGELTLVRPAVRRYAAAEAMAVHARDLVAPSAGGAERSPRRWPIARWWSARPAAAVRIAPAPRTSRRWRPALLAAARTARWRMLFGPEDHGLTNEDLRHCQRLISDRHQPGLRVAQPRPGGPAGLLRAAPRRARRRPPQRPQRLPAPAAAVQRMYEHLQRALLSIGFLHPQNPEHIMFALRRLFGRAGLEEHEVRILLGIARQIEWFARAAQRTPAAPRRAVERHRSPVGGHRSRGSRAGRTFAFAHG